MSNKYDFYDLEKVEELAGRPETIEIDGYYWDPTDLPPKDYLDTQVPLQFKNIGKWMRSKMNGLQTRETMARLAEMVGINTHKAVDVAERTQIRQDNLETQTAQSVAQMQAEKDAVIANATVDSEVILARGGKPTLQARLDETTANIDRNEANVAKVGFRLSWLEATEGEDITDIINATIVTHDKVIVDKLFWVDAVKSIKLRSGSSLIFEGDGALRALPNTAGNYAVIKGENISNIEIIKPVIVGDRNEHLGTTGEWGMGIELKGCTDYKIIEPDIEDCWGDGIYLGRTTSVNRCSRGYIKYGEVKNSRRNGMSVISVKGLHVKGLRLLNTIGTPPQAGVDFEPNGSDEYLQDILFEDVVTSGSGRNGFEIYLNSYSSTTDGRELSMTFRNCRSENDTDWGFYIGRFNGKVTGKIIVDDLTVKNSGRSGIKMRSVSKNIGKVIFNRPRLIDCNPTQQDGRALGADISIERAVNDYIGSDFKMGGIEIIDPEFVSTMAINRVAERLSFIDNSNTDSDVFDSVKIKTEERAISRAHLLRNSSIRSDKPVKQTLSNLGNSTTFPRAFDYYNCLAFSGGAHNSIDLLDVYFEQELAVVNEDPISSAVKSIVPPVGKQLYPTQYANGIKTSDMGASLIVYKIGENWAVKNITGAWNAI